ncbi:unnamed protein product [Sympodiomycopsis kandeliae]
MASNPNMDALLKWSMRNQDPSGPSPDQIMTDLKDGKRPDLDPKVLDAMMGKSEAQMMQEELSVAVNQNRSEEDRAVALDNFEMLIESIDNANLITSMKMWQPLLGLLESDSHRIQVASLWILGTAIQNNPSAQNALLDAGKEGSLRPLEIFLSLLNDSPDAAVRAKAMYALSAMLGHHPRAVQEFEQKGGYETFKRALQDPSINLRRKTAFLTSSLLNQDDSPEQTAASQPLLLGGPSSAATNSTTPATPPPSSTASRATAVGPVQDGGTSNPAPLEKPPVTSTLASGIVHPSTAAGLINSHLLHLLIASILPSDSPFASEVGLSAPQLGPDGDSEAREDEDYSEKALGAIVAFVSKYTQAQPQNRVALDHSAKRGLRLVRDEMSEGGLGKRLWDWKTLNIDQTEWEKFEKAVETIAV